MCQFCVKIRAKNVVLTKILLSGLKCYKDTHRKAYDITKVTSELKSDNVGYSTGCFGASER